MQTTAHTLDPESKSTKEEIGLLLILLLILYSIEIEVAMLFFGETIAKVTNEFFDFEERYFKKKTGAQNEIALKANKILTKNPDWIAVQYDFNPGAKYHFNLSLPRLQEYGPLIFCNVWPFTIRSWSEDPNVFAVSQIHCYAVDGHLFY